MSFVFSSSLLWQADGRDDGVSISWTKISLHAVSVDPVKCIYFMLDYRLLWPDGNGDISENEDNVDEGNYDGENYIVASKLCYYKIILILDEDAEMTQMWLIPADSEEVDKIYSTMVQCQILNPDPNDSLSEDGEIFIDYKICYPKNLYRASESLPHSSSLFLSKTTYMFMEIACSSARKHHFHHFPL